MICWCIKYRDGSWIILLVILVVFNSLIGFPKTYTLEGTITKLTRKSLVIEKNGVSTLINNCNLRSIDAVISVEGVVQRIESAPTTYGAQFSTWAKQQKIEYSIYAKNCRLLKQKKTPRHYIQQKIEKLDPLLQELAYKIIFLVPLNETSFWAFYNQMGFSCIGIVALLRAGGKYFLTSKQLAVVELLLLLAFALFYQFSFVCVRMLLSFVLRYSKQSHIVRTGILGCSCLVLFPQKGLTCAFLLPLGIRLARQLYPQTKHLAPAFWLVLVQSIYFSQIQLGFIIAYRFLLPFYGLISSCTWLALLWNQPLLLQLADLFMNVISLAKDTVIVGHPLGFGFLLYCLLLLCIPRFKMSMSILLYLVFCSTGLFHPLSEVVFLQIGQGDAMIVREAFNASVTLVDVGDEKNYGLLKQALYARGIRVIDQIILTHDDRDHSGSLVKIQNDFNIKQVIKEPQDIHLESMVFKSLNMKLYSNDNDNSLVYVLFVKDLQFLLTGDISSKVEKDLVDAYDLSGIDVVKLAHHGSKTSTSAQLLIETKCQLAINSSGLNNRYNHPHQEVLERINDFGHSYLDTQKEGDISVFFIRNWNFFITSSKKIGIIEKE